MAVELEHIRVESGEHVVQFYEDESQLAHTVGGYLARAIEDDAVAIVIATPAHRRRFSAELEVAGLDPAGLIRDRVLILLDAAETMAGFTRSGGVDRDQFRAIVGSTLRRAAGTGRPVRAFGEMVALLWEAGDVLAAIELERAWNDLAREVPFALMCAYRSDAVEGQEHAEALHEVCHLHTAVLDSPADAPHAGPTGPKVCADFAAGRLAPAAARQFAAEVLTSWGHSASLLEDAKLVVSELASNAVLHTRSAFSVEIRPHGATVRVSVRDASPVRPVLCNDRTAVSGRGVFLVDALSANWGVDLVPGGKWVWAELRP